MKKKSIYSSEHEKNDFLLKISDDDDVSELSKFTSRTTADCIEQHVLPLLSGPLLAVRLVCVNGNKSVGCHNIHPYVVKVC